MAHLVFAYDRMQVLNLRERAQGVSAELDDHAIEHSALVAALRGGVAVADEIAARVVRLVAPALVAYALGRYRLELGRVRTREQRRSPATLAVTGVQVGHQDLRITFTQRDELALEERGLGLGLVAAIEDAFGRCVLTSERGLTQRTEAVSARRARERGEEARPRRQTIVVGLRGLEHACEQLVAARFARIQSLAIAGEVAV